MPLKEVIATCDICGKDYNVHITEIKGYNRFYGSPCGTRTYYGASEGFSTDFECPACRTRIEYVSFLEAKKIKGETPKERGKFTRKLQAIAKKSHQPKDKL